MQLTQVNPKRLKKYGKLVTYKDGTRTLYLQEGVHTTIQPVKDNIVKPLNQ